MISLNCIASIINHTIMWQMNQLHQIPLSPLKSTFIEKLPIIPFKRLSVVGSRKVAAATMYFLIRNHLALLCIYSLTLFCPLIGCKTKSRLMPAQPSTLSKIANAIMWSSPIYLAKCLRPSPLLICWWTTSSTALSRSDLL